MPLGERGTQRVGDEAVGERLLARVRAHGHRDRAERARMRDVLLAEPRLADAGLALERDDATVVGAHAA